MTTGMTRDQTKDLTPGPRAPPSQGPVMRRSRSLSELPGSVRVPILKRTDNERMRARLEAGFQGLQELKLLREQQQRQMEEVRNSALQKKPAVSSQGNRFSQSQPQLNQRRMSSASLRLSSQSLARINEEGDDNGGGYSNSRLQDCTNLADSRIYHRRHSSFNLEPSRYRVASSTSDSDVFEPQTYGSSEVLRKTQSWSAIPPSYESRTASSESLNECYKESPNQFTNIQNRKNQRSMSFCVVANSSSDYMRNRDSLRDVNNENIEPKLRRASIQCDAVLTGSNKKNQGIFKDVDLSNIAADSPGPLHAVLHGFKASQGKISDSSKVPNGVKRSGSFAGTNSVRKPDTVTSRPPQSSGEHHSQSNGHRFVSHRRAHSETDFIVRLTKGVSLPGNIHDLSGKTEAVNNYFRRHSGSGSTQVWKGRDEKHHLMATRTDSREAKRDRSAQRSPVLQEEEQEERRLSEGNVFVDDQDSRPVPDKDKSQDGPKERSPRSSGKDEKNAGVNSSTFTQARNIVQSSNQTSPVSAPYHEKKFSIASDEGYVTSPPSTPRGRHALSIVSDSSWISTDFDDTASSCDVSPPQGIQSTTLQLKRSDLSQDYSKAKLSRKSSDYEGSSDFDRNKNKNYRKDDVGARQELFRYDSCDSLPFRQTAV